MASSSMNNDLYFVDMPADDECEERTGETEGFSRRLQAPPLPSDEVVNTEEGNGNNNENALAELEDIPMAATNKKKRVNRGPKLDTTRLLGSRGLPALQTTMTEVKFSGKGHEGKDLDLLLLKLEHWAHRLYPKLAFDDCLEKIEKLGHKKEMQACLNRMRRGLPVLDTELQSTVVTEDLPNPAGEDSEIEYDNDDANDDNTPAPSFLSLYGGVQHENNQ